MDELLEGGLYSGQLYELCGLSSSGKTQLCLTIAANAIIQSDIIIWYFDLKRDFSNLRYEKILKVRNLKQKVIIWNVSKDIDSLVNQVNSQIVDANLDY